MWYITFVFVVATEGEEIHQTAPWLHLWFCTTVREGRLIEGGREGGRVGIKAGKAARQASLVNSLSLSLFLLDEKCHPQQLE